ncbi:hypothetical protein B0H67DRAFT_135697 [Lasiosphaeris hirsuta]|uniref:Uncharacterized protein n=1 Tax=Lasiosphaeris hirsuta TaxID=260670 RepID=A0AA40E2J0_9PEZI|nr:hypothetical protein B0H67DRAFT_135697 [Lasiosphaeris hirsuta]
MERSCCLPCFMYPRSFSSSSFLCVLAFPSAAGTLGGMGCVCHLGGDGGLFLFSLSLTADIFPESRRGSFMYSIAGHSSVVFVT